MRINLSLDSSIQIETWTYISMNDGFIQLLSYIGGLKVALFLISSFIVSMISGNLFRLSIISDLFWIQKLYQDETNKKLQGLSVEELKLSKK